MSLADKASGQIVDPKRRGFRFNVDGGNNLSIHWNGCFWKVLLNSSRWLGQGGLTAY